MVRNLASTWLSDDAYSPRLDEPETRRLVEDATGFTGDVWSRPRGLREFDTWVVDDEWIVRLARRQADAFKLERERRLLQRVALPVQVPLIERWADGMAVHRKVRGIPADELLPSEEQWPGLAAQIGSLVEALHATELEIASQAALEAAAAEPPERMRGRVTWALEILQHELPAGAESLADDVAALHDAPNDDLVVCYGDFKGEHVLLSEDARQIAGVIDWADVQLHRREHDFAALVAWLGPRFARLVAAQHYGHSVDLEAAIVAARAWAVTSLAEAVAQKEDWPAEPMWGTAERDQAFSDRRDYWMKAVVATYDE